MHMRTTAQPQFGAIYLAKSNRYWATPEVWVAEHLENDPTKPVTGWTHRDDLQYTWNGMKGKEYVTRWQQTGYISERENPKKKQYGTETGFDWWNSSGQHYIVTDGPPLSSNIPGGTPGYNHCKQLEQLFDKDFMEQYGLSHYPIETWQKLHQQAQRLSADSWTSRTPWLENPLVQTVFRWLGIRP